MAIKEPKTKAETKRHFSVFAVDNSSKNAYLNLSTAESKPLNHETRGSMKNPENLKLRSSSIFAFQNDHIYSKLCQDDDKISELGSYNNTSNFFSNMGEPPNLLFFISKKGNIDEENDNSSSTISSDYEKNMDNILDEINKKREELNEAKISLDEMSRGSDGSSQKSEKYDGIEEIVIEKNFDRYKKRFSLENGSLVTYHTSQQKIMQKNPEDFNSMDWSYSNRSSTSPIVSLSPNKNHPGMNYINNLNQFRNNLTKKAGNVISPSNRILNGSGNRYGMGNMYSQSKPDSDECSFNNSMNRSSQVKNMEKQLFSDAFSLNLMGYNHPPTNFPGPIKCQPISNNNSFNNSPSHNMNYMSKNPSLSAPIFNMMNSMHLNQSAHYSDDAKILDNVFNLLTEQTGCRYLQIRIEEKIKQGDFEFLRKFFDKILDKLPDIINDQFGNYVIQKFFEGVANEKDILTEFFHRIKGDLFAISINQFGTRFFQRALESLAVNNVNITHINEILKNLITSHTYDLIIDTNGNHVFQKMFNLFPRDRNNFIFEELNKISFVVAKIKQGGCIFQRAFDIGNMDQKKFIIYEILKNIDILINDEYGNFIIQSVVYLKIPEINDMIFDYLKTRLLELSKRKFSSNVIDKCILLEDSFNKYKLRNDIINTLITNKHISELICDVYGNYVVQKALQVSFGIKFMEIIHEIKSNLKTLKQSAHGKKIYENLIHQYGDYFQQTNNNTKYKNINDGRRKSHI